MSRDQTSGLSPRKQGNMHKQDRAPGAGKVLRDAGSVICLNRDSNLMKLVGVLAMTCDHVGKKLLPDLLALQLIGRIAFPLFACCVVLGVLYTRDVRRYAMRLALAALVSQPFYVLMGYPAPAAFWENLWRGNVLFTLLLGLCAVWGLHTRRWWLSAATMLLAGLLPVDYGWQGVLLMMVLYGFRENRAAGVLAALVLLGAGFWEGGPQMRLGPLTLGIQGFSLLALPLLFASTHSGLRLPRWFFYAYYPAHMAAIWLLRLALRR